MVSNKVYLEDKQNSNVEEVITLESIAPQLDDPVVDVLVKYIADIRTLLVKHEINTSNEAFDNKDIATLFEKIDTALSNRFGVSFKHFYNTFEIAYAVMPIAPYNNHVFNERLYYAYNDLIKQAKHIKAADDYMPDNKDFRKFIKVASESVTEMKEAEIRIDFKEAKIYCDKPITVPLTLDVSVLFFPSQLNTNGLTDREIVTCMLHEVGHAFTYLEHSSRQVKNILSITDKINTSLNVKNESPRKTMEIVYSDSINKGKTDSQYKLAIVIRTIKEIVDTSVTHYGSSDAERLADDFAINFGLGKELANVRVMFHRTQMKMRYFKLASNIYVPKTLIYVYMIILVLDVLAGVPLLLLPLILLADVVITSFIIGLIAYGLTRGKEVKRDYAITKKELINIKLELINIIKQTDKHNVATEHVISAYNEVKELIDRQDDKSTGLMDNFAFKTIYDYIFGKPNTKAMDVNRILSLTDELINNDVFMASAKVKGI